MWQQPNHNRAAAEIRRRKKKQQAKQKSGLHIRRVSAQIQGAATDMARVRVLLNDLSPHGLEIFSPQALTPGNEVEITLEHPKLLFVKARVLFSDHYNSSSRVISQQPYPYRVGIVFLFQSEQEEKDVREFLEKTALECNGAPRAQAA